MKDLQPLKSIGIIHPAKSIDSIRNPFQHQVRRVLIDYQPPFS